MSLGYVKGKYWVPDTRYEKYAQWNSYGTLLKALRKANFSFDCSYSYTGRSYTASIQTVEKFENSGRFYFIKHNNAYDPNPLAAIVKACTEFEGCTLLVRAVCLEIECALLKETYDRAVDRERQLLRLLDNLAALLREAAKITQPTWDEVFADMEKTEGGYADRKGIEASKRPPARDHGDEYDRWSHLIITGKPRPLPAAPDEDDDL
jgi:hypothetical protein